MMYRFHSSYECKTTFIKISSSSSTDCSDSNKNYETTSDISEVFHFTASFTYLSFFLVRHHVVNFAVSLFTFRKFLNEKKKSWVKTITFYFATFSLDNILLTTKVSTWLRNIYLTLVKFDGKSFHLKFVV